MNYGFFTDRGLDKQNLNADPWNKLEWHPDINSYGYRCQEWDGVMPEGKKNVVILGCSHTFGQGLRPKEHWVFDVSRHNNQRLRYWNLGVPGASGECCVRRLWGSQKLIDPKIVIMCWPDISRRAWYGDDTPVPLHGTEKQNQYWDKFEQRVPYNEPCFALDGKHYGQKHHHRFAQLFLEKFSTKLK